MKIAVIIVGKINQDIKNDYFDKIMKNIIRCYDLDNENTDIFIYNNCSKETNNRLSNYFKQNKIKCLKTIKMTDHEKICQEKAINCNDIIKENFNKFKKLCMDENILGNNELSHHVPFNNISFFKKNAFKSAFHQYYQIYLSLLEIINYENNNNFEYDFIMKIRPDFFLKHDKFGPNHYFNDKNHILLKSYKNLEKYYNKINEPDNYHHKEFRINNYLFWRTTKFLGGQFILNKDSYAQIKDSLNNLEDFNNKIKDKFVISINDACFFSSGVNFKKHITELFNHFGEFYDNNVKFWWTAEAQFQLSILKNNLYFFDYLQNNNYYRGTEMWVNDYHGMEKYNKDEMNTNKVKKTTIINKWYCPNCNFRSTRQRNIIIHKKSCIKL